MKSKIHEYKKNNFKSMSKIKFNILLLICFGMLSVTAQTAKKPAVKTSKAPAASTSKKSTAASADGIFAEFETSKGKITCITNKNTCTISRFYT